MTGLPEGWRGAPLAEICEVVSGGTPKTGVAAYWDGDIPWVTPKDLSVDKSQVVHGGARSITREGLANSSAKLFPAGSVIVSSRAPIGYVAIAGEPMSTNQGCKIAVPPSEIDSRYLYWYLLQAKHDMEARASGTTFKEISGKEFGRTLLRWPALSEQRRIIEILEEHLSRLDAARLGLSTARRRTDLFRVCALTSIWEESDRLGSRRRVGELGGVVTGATPRDRAPDPGRPTVPFVTPGDVGHGEKLGTIARAFPLEAYPARRVLGRPAVVAVCIGATLGKIGWTDRPIGTNQQINALLVDEDFPAFVAALMSAPAFQSQMKESASATTMPILNKRVFSRLEVPIPGLDEQRRLLSRLDSMIDAKGRLQAGVALSEWRRERLRRTLLAAAFSGRLSRRSSNDEAVQELADD